jgi:hypothetical protein
MLCRPTKEFFMTQTRDFGRRIELVSMDPHFQSISIGLYRTDTERGPQFRVHSYSSKPGTAGRVAFVVQAMGVLGGMEQTNETATVCLPCQGIHIAAVRRVFLEACKVDPSEVLQIRPLWILDKKSGRKVTVTSEGKGLYRLAADGEEQDKTARIAAVANGLVKLGQMDLVPPGAECVAFNCGQRHDAMVGLLLIRALNVRAIVREEEMAASRGVLAAPSAQK